ncbi:DUF2059 domain-containing protein [Psychrobacter maritimus]|uniref:DUF2059 domain-containing protein n=1 Tax=Psychrobacter maritimus TaxID=256325 RepID=UPI001D0FC3BE|nr:MULTISPECIES: DUF2059 domain-containing protein [Psychrobacter]WGV12141.1 DUF2059 domain-containing protein [Psychrobacter sp. WB2]
MKRFNNATIKKSRQRTTIINPLLSLVVVTLMSAPIVNANAELIIHSEPNTVNKDVNKIANQHNNKQAPTDVSIIKLMQVMHIDEQIESIVNGQQAAIDAINMQTQNQAKKGSQQINDKSLNKRQRQLQEQIRSVLGQYAKIMSNGIGDATDAQTLTQAYISAAKTYYTQAEVDAQIKFYDTEMGQSILAKQPQITAAFLQQSLPEDTSETEAQLGELLPQMKQIIKGIF